MVGIEVSQSDMNIRNVYTATAAVGSANAAAATKKKQAHALKPLLDFHCVEDVIQ